MTLGKSRTGYTLVFERTRTGYSAYVPDLPGCVTTGRTLEQTKRNMDVAITIQQQGLRKQGLLVRRPRSLAELRRKRIAVSCALSYN